MTVDSFDSQVGDYPSGIILPWYSSDKSVPPGWFLCNGNNGTPDLRDRFVKSVPDGTTDPGATGGESSKSLSTSQLPAHNHTGSTNNSGGHDHSFGAESHSIGSGNSGDHCMGYGSTNVSSDGSHSHSLSVNDSGGDGSYDNRPKHLTMFFIKKA